MPFFLKCSTLDQLLEKNTFGSSKLATLLSGGEGNVLIYTGPYGSTGPTSGVRQVF